MEEESSRVNCWFLTGWLGAGEVIWDRYRRSELGGDSGTVRSFLYSWWLWTACEISRWSCSGTMRNLCLRLGSGTGWASQIWKSEMRNAPKPETYWVPTCRSKAILVKAFQTSDLTMYPANIPKSKKTQRPHHSSWEAEALLIGWGLRTESLLHRGVWTSGFCGEIEKHWQTSKELPVIYFTYES